MTATIRETSLTRIGKFVFADHDTDATCPCCGEPLRSQQNWADAEMADVFCSRACAAQSEIDSRINT